MSIYGISDLHLSFNKPVDLYQIDPEQDINKPMEIFGWDQHYIQIRDHWLGMITQEDTVLIPGDISWALKLEEAKNDFHWLAQLPGKKILSPGNHCYYAQSKKKVRDALPEGFAWIDADYVTVEDYVVVGTRGWILPGDPQFQPETDQRIYDRQVGRLKIALEAAHRAEPDRSIITMLHYPPITKKVLDSGFFQVMKEYGVTLCIYGHLHGQAAHEAVEGNVEGIELRLVACDALQFRPLLLSSILK